MARGGARGGAGGASVRDRIRRRTTRRVLVAGSTATAAVLLVVVGLGWHYDVAGLRSPPGHVFGPVNTDGPGSFRFLATQPGDTDDPVAYDPCRTIRVLYNPRGAPAVGEALTREAVRAVAQASGLSIVYAGRTDLRPTDKRLDSPFGTDGPPRVLVSFATAQEVPGLAGKVVGLGGSTRVDDDAGRGTYVSGQVTLDTASFDRVLARINGRARAEAVVRHEFGHVIGLDHVPDNQELMNGLNVGLLDYGPGDRRGLAALGRGRCR